MIFKKGQKVKHKENRETGIVIWSNLYSTSIQTPDKNKPICFKTSDLCTVFKKEVFMKKKHILPITKDIIFHPIDVTIGDLFNIEDFKNAVKFGAFVDYDGFGVLATSEQMSSIEIKPSQTLKYNIPDWVTHIIWYNR